MRLRRLIFLFLVAGYTFSCVPIEKISRHDFNSGYYSLKTAADSISDVYLDVIEDSVVVYPTVIRGGKKIPDKNSPVSINISDIKSGDHFYKSTFRHNSIDVDLSTIILKFRPAMGGVPNQLSSNINAALYAGFRKDFFKVRPYNSPLRGETSFIMQIGFDFGLFAGIGITPINPTVTRFSSLQEYDGMVLQKGIAGYVTFDNISLGITLGFDNLMDKNKSTWIYNQKPYIGLAIGISNF
jgi:hypothetical protein